MTGVEYRPDQLAVNIKLPTSRRALAFLDVGFAAHLELESQVVAFLRDCGLRFNVIEAAAHAVAYVAEEKTKSPPSNQRRRALEKSRRRPTLPHSYPCSTIGAGGLNFCVRNGNRCDPSAIATENRKTMTIPYLQPKKNSGDYGQAARPISTSKLNPLLGLHPWPINLVVYKGSLAPVSPPERDI